MEKFIAWLTAKPRQSRVTSLALMAIAPVVLVVVAAFALPVATPILGAVAGAGLFMAGYGYWRTCMDPAKQEETNLKNKYPLKKRRALVLAWAGVWLIILLGSNSFIPEPILGTANVLIIISLYWAWRATPEEAAQAAAEWEARQAELEAEQDNPDTTES